MLLPLLASCLVALSGPAGAVEAAAGGRQDSHGAKPSLSSLPGSLQEQNPHNVAVTRIHMVVSSHLDVGCKTPGCGVTRPGEPDRCARVIPNLPKHPGGMGEPWAYHIVNRYFDEYIPNAIANAVAGRAAGVPYSYMIQAWVASLYLDCANAGMLFWPEIGSEAKARTTSLHCPNASSVTRFRSALKRGDLFYHAFAHNGEASTYPDASLFAAGIELGAQIADDVGFPRPIAVSIRDVPGWTRATLPILNEHGVVGLSFGAGTPPGKVDVPPLAVWRDEASGAEVVLTYETAYGTIATVFVLPNGVALCAAWAGDNTGPPPLADVQRFYATLRSAYPAAEVVTSTFDDFFAIANQPKIKAKLPVVTEEIEDSWIYGVPSDPLKNAQLREASRQRLACLSDGKCTKASKALTAFTRLLIKVPEHTWGVSQIWFLPDYMNYTNTQFDKARAQQALGFVADNREHADYNTTVNSWIEQRAFVTQAPLLLEAEFPELAANITAALVDLKNVVPPSPAGMSPVKTLTAPISCGKVELKIGRGGGIVSLQHGAGGRQWAGPDNPIGQFLYETYVMEDYTVFLHDIGSRIGDKGVWPQHTEGPFANNTVTCEDDANFCKANFSAANPKRRSIVPTVTGIWSKSDGPDGCTVVIESALPAEANSAAGAPTSVVAKLTVSAMGAVFDWDFVQVNKRPTRLPESTFFSFNPVVSDPRGWGLTVLGSEMDPLDVVGKLAKGPNPMFNYLDSVYGGSPHLRGVEDAHYSDKAASDCEFCRGFELTSLDVPVMCTGTPTPFITPRTGPPDMAEGVSWNIYQNIWNTNYVLWYPFEVADKHIRSRFRMQFH